MPFVADGEVHRPTVDEKEIRGIINDFLLHCSGDKNIQIPKIKGSVTRQEIVAKVKTMTSDKNIIGKVEKCLPKFDLLKRVNMGYFGTVWKAKMNGREVIVRKMENSKYKQNNAVILSALSDKNYKHAPKLHNTYTVNGPRGVVFRFNVLEDVSEYRLLSQLKGKLTSADIDAISKKLVTAIKDLHTAKYYHGRISAENVLYDLGKKEIKLVNFGMGGVRGQPVDLSDPTIKDGLFGTDVYHIGVLLSDLIGNGEPYLSNKGNKNTGSGINPKYKVSPKFRDNEHIRLLPAAFMNYDIIARKAQASQ